MAMLLDDVGAPNPSATRSTGVLTQGVSLSYGSIDAVVGSKMPLNPDTAFIPKQNARTIW